MRFGLLQLHPSLASWSLLQQKRDAEKEREKQMLHLMSRFDGLMGLVRLRLTTRAKTDQALALLT
jgi:hypothetical protein